MIEIVTFHKTANYGALLQSLSLKEFVEENTSQNVKMCSYHPKMLTYAEFYRPLITKKIKKFIKILKKNIEIYFWYKEAFKEKVVNEKKVLTIYGSDEIWNFQNSYHGYDPYYFGKKNFAPKISYAASIGRSSLVEADEYIKDEIKKYLKQFQSIAVRDTNTKNFIRELTSVDPTIVVDPTLIHTPKILNEQKFIKLRINQKYLVVYGTVFSKKQKELILNFSKEKNLMIISVGYYNSWIDKNYLGLNPTNFIDIIKNSFYVFTSMFHGVMFSIKYSKQFYLSVDPIRKNKLEDIIENLNLNSRIFNEKINFQNIDYEKLYKDLDPLIKHSQKILINSINKVIKN
jgi:hypothetical protein